MLGMRLSPGLCPQLIFCNPVVQAFFHVVVKSEHDPSLVTMDGLVLLGRPIPCSRTFNLLVAICHDCDLFPYSDYFLDAPSTQTRPGLPEHSLHTVSSLQHISFTIVRMQQDWSSSLLIAWGLPEGRNQVCLYPCHVPSAFQHRTWHLLDTQ